MDEKQKKGSGLSAKRLFLVFFLIGLANIYSVFQRFALGVISNDLALEFSMTPVQLGTLASCFLYSYASMQILSGLVTSKIGVRTLISATLLLSAVVTFLFTTASSVGHLMFLRVLVGVGCSFIYVPALQAIRKLAPPAWTTTAMGFCLSIGHVGALFATTPLKALCNAFGWRTIFLWVAASVLLLGVLVWIFLPREPRQKAVASEGRIFREVKKDFGCMLIPGVFIMIVWSFMTGGPRQAFQSMWGAQFYENAAGYSDALMSNMLIYLSIGCAIGGPLFGWLSKQWGVMKTLVITSIILAGIWLLLVPSVIWTPPIIQRALLFIMGAAGTGGFTCVFATVKYFNIPQAAGLFIGVVNSVNFFASAIFSQLMGITVQYGTAYAPLKLYAAMFSVFAVIILAVLLVLCKINRKALHTL